MAGSGEPQGELMAPVRAEQPAAAGPVAAAAAVFSERVALKLSSGRLVCMVLGMAVLCLLVCRDAVTWKDPFLMVLSGLVGSYTTASAGGTR